MKSLYKNNRGILRPQDKPSNREFSSQMITLFGACANNHFRVIQSNLPKAEVVFRLANNMKTMRKYFSKKRAHGGVVAGPYYIHIYILLSS